MDSQVAIEVKDLSRDFRTFSRREGVWGGIRDLFHREYRNLLAVDSISFQVLQGQMVGFIGPNGAGKSTTIKMLTGILRPTRGEILALGLNPYRDRKRYCARIGVVFGQRTQLWWDIAVIESFNLLASIYRVPEAEYRHRLAHLVEILELKEFLHTPVRKLSLGQRLRSDIAASLLHGPELLFLDEPTIGVDAVAKLNIRAFLKRINQEFKTTILLTTHDLVEIEELCERIIIIDRGHIVYDGSLDKIRQLPGVKRQIYVQFTGAVTPEELRARFHGKAEFRSENGKIVAEFRSEDTSTIALVRDLVGSYEVADLSTREPDIEDILIKIYREGVPGGAA